VGNGGSDAAATNIPDPYNPCLVTWEDNFREVFFEFIFHNYGSWNYDHDFGNLGEATWSIG
jgi:hypothetical protein